MSREPLHIQDQRIYPVRGLAPLHNRLGRLFPLIDLHRWIRLCRTVYKTQKIDLVCHAPVPGHFAELLAYAGDPQMGLSTRLSLRTDGETPPGDLATHAGAGLFDVFLTPREFDRIAGSEWLDACAGAGLPVRLQLPMIVPREFDAEVAARKWLEAGVRSVNFALDDPFTGGASGTGDRTALDRLATLARTLEDAGIEVNLVGAPFCAFPEAQWPKVLNAPQFFLDHQQYHRPSYELAARLYGHRPFVVSRAIATYLARYTSRESLVDKYLLEFLIRKHPVAHSVFSAVRKLTRHLPFAGNSPKPIEESEAAYEREIARRDAARAKSLGPVCSACALHRICDGPTRRFRRAFPGIAPAAQRCAVVVSPMHFAQHQPKYYDAIDAARRDFPQAKHALAAQANHVANNVPPDQTFNFGHFHAVNTFFVQLPGAIRWFSLSGEEKLSTVLFWAKAPFTISITFGGGLADYIGFSIGRHIKLLCPMEAYSHKLVLHADARGNYVLLRDGVLMRPVEFEGVDGVPAMLPTVAPVQLSIWNIDNSIFTQNLLLWEGGPAAKAPAASAKYSVVIVSMRFTRRLQAVLLSLAHQQGIDPAHIEIIVAYVPGIDATDDLISSMEAAFPAMRIVRSPFPERYLNAKGFVINESLRLASGEWTMILDSDILLPPDLFARFDRVENPGSFIAPDRRKMLTPETTAKILLGEVEPWSQWDELLAGPGEERVREGGFLPIGFCQCVRAECAKKVAYTEFNHFEGADWDFIAAIHREFGDGTWIDGTAVLHLDHGGSQWYGARRHL